MSNPSNKETFERGLDEAKIGAGNQLGVIADKLYATGATGQGQHKKKLLVKEMGDANDRQQDASQYLKRMLLSAVAEQDAKGTSPPNDGGQGSSKDGANAESSRWAARE